MPSISGVQTLQALIGARETSPEPWLILPKDPMRSEDAVRFSFGDICEKARQFALGLLRTRLPLQDRPIILVFDNGERFCVAFLGCLLAGALPSVRSPPWLHPRFAAELQRIVEQSNASLVVVDDGYHDAISDACPQSASCMVIDEIVALGNAPSAWPMVRQPRDLALLQYSSGSTRVPLGVGLSHAAILSNVRSIGAALKVSADDVVVSWLPVAHDMGLIASLIFSVYWGVPFVFLSPLEFVGKPARWLWALSRFRGTISPAPNFAFHLCASPKRVPDAILQGLDLASWRAAICGAETVQLSTVQAFSDRFAPHGFREESFCPAYGLAENSVACTIASPKVEPRADLVDRDLLETKGLATALSAAHGKRACALLSTGAPIDGTQVRIAGEDGRELPVRAVGEIHLRGTSMMSGYWRSPEATAAVMTTDGWLRTGDIGYMSDGELHIVGRCKQMIKRAGRCYDGAEMAEAAGQVPGIRRGCVSVFGIPDAVLGTERIVVLAEVKDHAVDFAPQTQAIVESMSSTFGLRPDEILLLKPGSIPKTSSGKIQSQQCRALYEGGALVSNLMFSFPPAARGGDCRVPSNE
jgi:acyl-CoA synthetase (AMP-forming)/AMP-acid ligase II